MHKHCLSMVFQGPIDSFYSPVTPRCVPFGPKYVDGICATEVPEGAGKLGATIVCQHARFADMLYVFLECIECVSFGSNGCHMQVASARVHKDSDVSVLPK